MRKDVVRSEKARPATAAAIRPSFENRAHQRVDYAVFARPPDISAATFPAVCVAHGHKRSYFIQLSNKMLYPETKALEADGAFLTSRSGHLGTSLDQLIGRIP